MNEDHTLFSKFGAFFDDETPKIEPKKVIEEKPIEIPTIKPKTLTFDEDKPEELKFDYKSTIISKNEDENKPVLKKYVREKLPLIQLDSIIDDEPISQKEIIQEKIIEKPIIQEKIIEKPIKMNEELDFTWKLLTNYYNIRKKILG